VTRAPRPRPVPCAASALILAATIVGAAGAPQAQAEPRQTGPCHIADSPPGEPLPDPAGYDTDALWRFGRGAGQTVAVIDTGVAAHPRLPTLRGGGDLVLADPAGGTEDCDAHGTLVAGLIAAAPSADDDFHGLAPDATILSIRQSSHRFSDPDADRDGTGSLATLATAIDLAVDGGATVINISEVACAPGLDGARSPALAAAVERAVDADVVIVAAAGNAGGDCVADPQPADPRNPTDRDAVRVHTDIAPAHFTDRVLTVAAVDPHGAPAEYSMPGPWVAVAAPGTAPMSLGTDELVATRVRTEHGVEPIVGTSFAAPLVAATAALVRARYPQLSAAEVIDRIVDTSVPIGGGWDPRTGHGLLDPVAALTAVDPPGSAPAASRVRTFSVPAPVPPPPDPAPHAARIVVAAAAVTALLVGAGIAGVRGRRRAR